MILYAVVEKIGLSGLFSRFLKPTHEERKFLDAYGGALREILHDFSGICTLETLMSDTFGLLNGGKYSFDADKLMKKGSDLDMIDVDPYTVTLNARGRYFVNNYL